MKAGDAVMRGVHTGRIVRVRQGKAGPLATVRWFNGDYSTVALSGLKPAADHCGGPRPPPRAA